MSFKVPLITGIRDYNTATVWTRPSDWIAITDAASEVQFLVSDIGSAIFTLRTNYTKPAAQNFYIDWGDGVTTTISATGQTDTAHTYTIGGGTACTLGYTTWKIRVYVDSGATISQCLFQQGTVNGVTQIPFAAIGLLEAYYGEGIGITSYNTYFYCATTAGNFFGSGFLWLKYVKLPASSDNITSMAETFYNCVSLARVTMPTSMSALIQSNGMFYSCRSLETITFPSNATGMTSFSNMFNLCANLTAVTFPTTLNSVTTFENAFTSCYNLNNITLPSMTSCTTYLGAFQSCYSIQNIKLTSWTATGVAITITNIWSVCYNLTSVIWPTSAAVGTTFVGGTGSIWSNCQNLSSVIFPEYFGGTAVAAGSQGIFNLSSANYSIQYLKYPTSLNSLINSFTITACANLVTLILPTTMSSYTGTITITSCAKLKSITLPTTVGATIQVPDLRNNFSLQSITYPSGWTLTGSASTRLNTCYSLQSITFPASINSVTDMSYFAQNCHNLTTVTMPTSMTGVTSIESMFQSCYKLNSIVFPATMNSCTQGLNIFRDCYNLTSVTMPTSMSACTDFSLAFINCFSLRTLTMPATVNISNYYTSLAGNCSSLTSLTLPTTQTTSLGSGGLGIMSGCPNLTTVNNMDKLGPTSTTVGTVQSGTGFATLTPQLTSTIDLYLRLTRLEVQGTATYRSRLSNVRLRNTGASQWTGTSPQINVSYTDMSTAQLNTLFADMAAQPVVTSKTIDITSATGAAGLSAGDRLVITSRGWTITG